MLVKLVEQDSSQQFPALFSVLFSSYMGTKNQKKTNHRLTARYTPTKLRVAGERRCWAFKNESKAITLFLQKTESKKFSISNPRMEKGNRIRLNKSERLF